MTSACLAAFFPASAPVAADAVLSPDRPPAIPADIAARAILRQFFLILRRIFQLIRRQIRIVPARLFQRIYLSLCSGNIRCLTANITDETYRLQPLLLFLFVKNRADAVVRMFCITAQTGYILLLVRCITNRNCSFRYRPSLRCLQ